MFLNKQRQEALMLKELEEKAYGSRDKVYSGDLYNFDLKPLIDEFSFEEFVNLKFSSAYGCTNMKPVNEYGAFLVITDKQYILGYNSDKGCGSHHCSFARCMADILGGNKINTYEDAKYYKGLCEHKYITARIIYEKDWTNLYGYPKFIGRILFNFGTEPITEGKLRSLEKFIEDHGKQLDYINKAYNFSIEYMTSYVTEKDCELSKILRFAQYNMDPYAISESNDDEVIVGVATEPQKTLTK